MKYVSILLFITISVFPSLLGLLSSVSVSFSLFLSTSLSASSIASGTELVLNKYVLSGRKFLCVVLFLCFLSCPFVCLSPFSLSLPFFFSVCLAALPPALAGTTHSPARAGLLYRFRKEYQSCWRNSPCLGLSLRSLKHIACISGFPLANCGCSLYSKQFVLPGTSHHSPLLQPWPLLLSSTCKKKNREECIGPESPRRPMAALRTWVTGHFISQRAA